MALDQRRFDLVTNFIREKRKNHQCLRCGVTNWAVHGVVKIHVQDIPSPVLVAGGPILPLAAVICLNCGTTEFVNMAVSGAIVEGDV